MKTLQNYYLDLLAAWGAYPLDKDEVKNILGNMLSKKRRKIGKKDKYGFDIHEGDTLKIDNGEEHEARERFVLAEVFYSEKYGDFGLLHRELPSKIAIPKLPEVWRQSEVIIKK